MGLPRRGFHRHWETPDAMYEDWTEYKEYQKNNTIEVAGKNGPYTMKRRLPTTIMSFCAWSGISRPKFYGYKDREGFPEILDLIATEHEAYVNEGVATGEFDSNWFKVYGPNAFGYKNNGVEFNLINSGMSEADRLLLEKVARLGLGEGAIECNDYTVSEGSTGEVRTENSK